MEAVFPAAASALARGRRARRRDPRARRTQPVTFAEIKEVDEEKENSEQGPETNGSRERRRRLDEVATSRRLGLDELATLRWRRGSGALSEEREGSPPLAPLRAASVPELHQRSPDHDSVPTDTKT